MERFFTKKETQVYCSREEPLYSWKRTKTTLDDDGKSGNTDRTVFCQPEGSTESRAKLQLTSYHLLNKEVWEE